MDPGIGGRRAPRLGCGRALAGAELVRQARGAGALEGAAAAVRAVAPATAEGQGLAAAGEADIRAAHPAAPRAEPGREDFLRAFEADMLAPGTPIRALVPRRAPRRWRRVVNLASQAMKAPVPPLVRPKSAQRGLPGFPAGLAGPGMAVNSLLPGAPGTGRTRRDRLSPGRMPRRRIAIPAGRDGTGCAFPGAQHAGAIAGQAILPGGDADNLTP